MYMFSQESSKSVTDQNGSALVISIIVLVILGILGLTALDVADINMFMAANDRDSKQSFFHADSGANIGHEFLEDAIFEGNLTYYSNTAATWMNADNCTSLDPSNPKWGDCSNCSSPATLSLYVNGQQATYVRAGWLGSGILEGSALQIGAGYEGIGKSAAGGGTYADYLVRSRRYGQRNSFAEVDLGWRHINR